MLSDNQMASSSISKCEAYLKLRAPMCSKRFERCGMDLMGNIMEISWTYFMSPRKWQIFQPHQLRIQWCPTRTRRCSKSSRPDAFLGDDVARSTYHVSVASFEHMIWISWGVLTYHWIDNQHRSIDCRFFSRKKTPTTAGSA